MDFHVLNSSGVWIGIVEIPTSAIWTRRYYTPGDFELYLPATEETLALLTEERYLIRDDAEEMMLIEHVEIHTDADEGNYVQVSGRGAECLLGRRIVWEQTTLSGRADAGIYKLTRENAVAPSIPARALPVVMQEPALAGLPIEWEMGTIETGAAAEGDSTTRFRCIGHIPIGGGLHIAMANTQRIHLYYFDADLNYIGYSGWHNVTSYTITPSTFEGAAYVRMIFANRDNTAIGSLAAASATVNVQHGIRAQYTGNNLLTTVEEICKAYGIGFRAVRSMRENGAYVPSIELMEGTDRSEGQTRTAPVIFSPEYENLLSSSYVLDTSKYKNVALVAGEGEGKDRKRVTYGNASGLARRELYVDARDLSTNGGEIADDEYTAQLTARGAEKIGEHAVTEAFDGEIDTSNTFVLDVDYTLGDIVTVENEYHIRKNVRVVAIMECWDENGYSAIPTYENVEV